MNKEQNLRFSTELTYSSMEFLLRQMEYTLLSPLFREGKMSCAPLVYASEQYPVY